MKRIATLITLLTVAAAAAGKDIDLGATGVRADGVTKVTERIQKAIDAVSRSGGGRVILSGGTFLSGSLQLKDGVELHIAAGATLFASPDIADFPMREIRHCNGPETFPRWSNKCFILADGAENIAITGQGRIDCNGDKHVREKTAPDWAGLRFERILPVEQTLPRVVFLAACRNVTVTDITMVGQPGGWTFWVSGCEDVTFNRCNILANVEYPNNDGIHINSSANVRVTNCNIETGDDCIVVRGLNRTLRKGRACENVTVSDCTLCSSCACIRIAYVGDGIVRNCSFSNLTMRNSFNGVMIELPVRGPKNDYGVEETLVENLSFSNITMSGISNFPVEIFIADDPTTPVKAIRDLVFSNIRSTSYRLPSLIGTPACHLQNIVFNGCSFTRIPYEESGCQWRRLTEKQKKNTTGLRMEHCDGVKFNNTEFKI